MTITSVDLTTQARKAAAARTVDASKVYGGETEVRALDEWRHLERAHILSQPVAGLHVRTHVAMLGAGLRRRDRREMLGQLLRLVVAGPGSLIRRYPVGNTGGALLPMTIPDDLRAVLEGPVPAEAGAS